jgi:hypothetical protein
MVVRFFACELIVLSTSDEDGGVGISGGGGALLTRTETSNLGSGGGTTMAVSVCSNALLSYDPAELTELG